MGDFFLSLEKDPQQEEFLQGCMQGNPYPSTTPGLGPLMRKVKNKICTGRDSVILSVSSVMLCFMSVSSVMLCFMSESSVMLCFICLCQV